MKHRGTACALFAIALIATAAKAQETGAESCAGIAGNTARLACYDAAFPPTVIPEQPPATPAATTTRSRSAWRSNSTTSAVDDSQRIVLSVESLEPIRSRFGSPGPADLMIRCEENTTSLFIHFNGLFMADIQSYGQVTTRIDDQRARTISMSASTNNEALGLWRGGASIPFIRTLFDGDRLFVRATPFNENRVEMTFPIAGLERAIEPLREACNW